MAGVTSVPFFNPADPSSANNQIALMRAQMLAQSLQKNAEMPNSADMVGQIAVPHSPLEYLARAGSGALAQRTQLDALKQSATIQQQQAQAIMGALGQGGGQGGGSSVNPALIASVANLYGPEAAKALGDDMARTGEMKNAGASGISSPLDYANALNANSARNSAHFAAPATVIDPNNPTGPATVIPQDIYADQLHGGAPQQPNAVPAKPFGMGGSSLPSANGNAPFNPANMGQPSTNGPGMSLPGANQIQGSALPAMDSNPVQQSPALQTLMSQGQPPQGQAAPVPPVQQNPMAPPQPQGIPTNVDQNMPVQPTPMSNQTASPAQIDIAKAKAMAPIEAGKAGLTKDTENVVDYKKGLISGVAEGEKAMNIINAQEDLLTKFKSGAWTSQKAELANAAASLGAPQNIVQGIAGGDPAAVQAFEGLASQHALLQLKSMLDGQKMSQGEFNSFKADLASPDKMEGAIRSINNMQRTMYKDQVDELGSLTQWEQQGKPITQFRQDYSQKRASELLKPKEQAGLPQGAKRIGTSSGKAVYQLPDGSHVMEQ